MFKFLLGFLKTPVANLVSSLQTNRTANINAIETTIGGGATTLNGAVGAFIANEAKKSEEIAIIAPIVEPELLSVLSNAEAAGTNTVPELYDKGVAWLQQEEADL